MADWFPKEHAAILLEVAFNEGFEDPSISTSSISKKGDNYLGQIKLVTVTDKNISNKTILNLVIKCAHTNENLRSIAPIEEGYHREVYLYDVLLPELSKFGNEYGVEFIRYPKIYGSCLEIQKECVLLENVFYNNFKLWDRKVAMDSEHTLLVCQNYAKFHAISMAMRCKNINKFTKITERIKYSAFKGVKSKNTDGWIKSASARFCDAIEILKENQKAVEVLQKFQSQLENFIFAEMVDEKIKIAVLHGDPWCNNMMFKYENNKTPKEICFLDWQLSLLGTPIRDLSYFLFVTCAKDIFDNIDFYLNAYYHTLSSTLEKLHCDPDKVFPRKLFEEHWTKFAKFGLYMALLNLKMFCGENDDIPDIEKGPNEGEDFLTTLNSGLNNYNLKYEGRLKDVVLFFAENNLV